MLKVYLIVFVLCVMSLGVLGGRTKHENNRTGISLYDKQHDYKYDFERVEVLRYNKHYMKQCHAVTFKYNRTCAVVNITFEYNMNVGYDVEVIFQGYKFASNEYRLFPIRFEMNMCRAVSKNIMGFADLQKGCGNFTECPFLKFQQHDYTFDFERAELLRYDERYVNQHHVVSFKYNRTCAAVNLTAEYKIDIGNNLEIMVQAYKFASNEYRLSPLRYQVNFCEAITKNIAGTLDLFKCGNFTGCPVLKRKPFKICNWRPNPEKFPPFIPNGQYMIVQGLYRSTELWITRGYGSISRPIPIPKN